MVRVLIRSLSQEGDYCCQSSFSHLVLTVNISKVKGEELGICRSLQYLPGTPHMENHGFSFVCSSDVCHR